MHRRCCAETRAENVSRPVPCTPVALPAQMRPVSAQTWTVSAQMRTSGGCAHELCNEQRRIDMPLHTHHRTNTSWGTQLFHAVLGKGNYVLQRMQARVLEYSASSSTHIAVIAQPANITSITGGITLWFVAVSMYPNAIIPTIITCT